MSLVRLLLSVFGSLLAGAVALACAGMVILAQGGRISPRLDVITHFAPIWLVGGLAALIWALVMRPSLARLTIATFAGVAVVGAISLILPEMTRRTSPEAPAGQTGQIRLIQFNVWGRNDRAAETADWIVAQKPDLIALEEASPAMREAIQARGDFHVACGNCSVMILSRLKPVTEAIPLRTRSGPRPPMAYARFHTEGRSFGLMVTHFTWPTDGRAQQIQGQHVADVLKQFPPETMILAGDFNSTPWSFTRRAQDRMFALERRTRALMSWPAAPVSRYRIALPFPFLAIDHVYAGSGWRTVKVRRGPRLGSDHYPVVVDLVPTSSD